MSRNDIDRIEYFDFPGFENIYLEDSYLLGVTEDETEIRFLLEVVLSNQHSKYSAPRTGEQHCYKRGEIVFQNVTKKGWNRKSMIPIADPSGEPDFGNIDVFIQQNGVYQIAGEWGEIYITGSKPELRLLDG